MKTNQMKKMTGVFGMSMGLILGLNATAQASDQCYYLAQLKGVTLKKSLSYFARSQIAVELNGSPISMLINDEKKEVLSLPVGNEKIEVQGAAVNLQERSVAQDPLSKDQVTDFSLNITDRTKGPSSYLTLNRRSFFPSIFSHDADVKTYKYTACNSIPELTQAGEELSCNTHMYFNDKVWVEILITRSCPKGGGRPSLWSMFIDQSISLEKDHSLADSIKGDLELLSEIHSDRTSPLHYQMFGDVEGTSYLKWFASKVRVITENTDSEHKSSADDEKGGKVMAFVNEGMAQSTVFVNKEIYLSQKYNPIFRASALLHEAKHLDPNTEEHVVCPKATSDRYGQISSKEFEGSVACDQTEKGSYGIQVVFLGNIAQNCTSCSKQMRAEAYIAAQYFFTRILDPHARAVLASDLDPAKARIKGKLQINNPYDFSEEFEGRDDQ